MKIGSGHARLAVRVVRVEELEAALHGALENAAKDNRGKQRVARLSGYSLGMARAVGPFLLTLISRVVKHSYLYLFE